MKFGYFLVMTAFSLIAGGAQAQESFLSKAVGFVKDTDLQVKGIHCFANIEASDSALTIRMRSRDGVRLTVTLDEKDLINGEPVSAHSTVRSNQLVFLFGENSGGVFAIEKKDDKIVDVTVAFEGEERDISCSIKD